MFKNCIQISILITVISLTSGCATPPGRGTATGAALGAATGAAIGSLSADAGKGALIGAGVGALGGYLVDSQHADRYPYHHRPPRRAYPCAPGFWLNRAGRCVR